MPSEFKLFNACESVDPLIIELSSIKLRQSQIVSYANNFFFKAGLHVLYFKQLTQICLPIFFFCDFSLSFYKKNRDQAGIASKSKYFKSYELPLSCSTFKTNKTLGISVVGQKRDVYRKSIKTKAKTLTFIML